MKEVNPNRTARFMPTNELILNPHIGFTTFQRFNGDEMNPLKDRRWTEGYPIQYQPDRGTRHNGDHPDTTVAYFRVYWRFFEPEDGKYNFELIDKALATAAERGQTLMFRLAPYGSVNDASVPDWLKDRNEAPILLGDNRSRPEYQEFYDRYARAIEVIGDHYKDDPRLDSVDMSIVGEWGEGAGTDDITHERRDKIISAYTDHFGDVPLMGFVISPDAVLKANEKRPVGYRADCLGDMSNWNHMIDYYPRRIAMMSDLWKKAPVSFEVCWVVYHWLDMGWDIDYTIEQSLKWHISTFNAKSSAIPPEWKSNVDEWLKRMGYRYCLRFFDYASNVAQGDIVNVGFWMENRGVAPTYHHYVPTLRLKNDQVTRCIPLAADPRDWLPGDSLWQGKVFIPMDLPAGSYDLQFGLVDPRTGEAAIKMPIQASADGLYVSLGAVTVNEQSN
ncbi:MAG: DUF4832 domain-containing protein [Clostridiales bacterium]|nr:DUF4832 domain-containing protein [Clostridiales bacterium]